MSMNSAGPTCRCAAWTDTCETLHRWTQIAGKVRLASTPLINHWWNVTFQVDARGLVAPANVWPGGTFDMTFDLQGHRFVIATGDGRSEGFALVPMTVADFYAALMERLRRLGIDIHIWTMPGEIENAVPFEQDRAHAQYDAAYASRFSPGALSIRPGDEPISRAFHRQGEPGAFLLGQFRPRGFSIFRSNGAPAAGVTPNVAAWVMTEAYSHEVSSCGFWPGNGGFGEAAFYVYAYPEPAGYGDTPLRTPGGRYDKDLGQFILPYDAVRQARDPDALLLGFLQETYEAAANLAHWDRAALERGDRAPA